MYSIIIKFCPYIFYFFIQVLHLYATLGVMTDLGILFIYKLQPGLCPLFFLSLLCLATSIIATFEYQYYFLESIQASLRLPGHFSVPIPPLSPSLPLSLLLQLSLKISVVALSLFHLLVRRLANFSQPEVAT